MVGAALISAGVGMIHLPSGVITGGVLLFGLGVIGHLRSAPEKKEEKVGG